MSQRPTDEFGSDSEREFPEVLGELDQAGIRDLLSALDISHSCIRDLDGTIRFWSRGNEQLYGWSTEEAIGRISHDLLKTVFPQPLAEINGAMLRQGSWTGELRHAAKSGGQIWVASNWAMQRDSEDRPRSVIEVNNDITETKRAGDAARYLASVVDASDDAIVSKDLNGIITSWNSGAERLYGYAASEMIGRSILKLFPPDMRGQEQEIQTRLRRGERISHFETVRLNKSGTLIDVSLTVSPIYNKAGEVIGASNIARDISERKALEDAYQESERRRRLATEAGELGLWSYDSDTQAMYWSARCKAIYGLPADAPIPSYKESLRLLHPDDAPLLDRTLRASAARRAPFELEYRIIRREDGIHWVQAKGRPGASTDEAVTQLHGTILDITRRKQTEEALKRSNSQLQQFAFAAAHDLQEPLRNVALSISLARSQVQGQLGAESEALLSTAAQSAQQMKEMVKALLAYSRVLQEEDESWPVADGRDVLAAVLRNLSAEIRETGAEITHELLPKVKVDRGHLLQILENLIGNALKYRGILPPRIHIGVSGRQRFWQICVKDNGIGIEPQFKERVFGVFKRLRLKDVPGTGIGLALCKRIVEHYGGRIWIESDGKTGTTFFFTVPAAEGASDDKSTQLSA